MLSTARPSRGSRERTPRVLLVAGASVVVAVALTVLIGGLVAGSPAADGALVGGAIALGFFLFGSTVVSAATRIAPQAAMLVALMTYALQVVLVALVFVLIAESGALGGTLAAAWLAGGLIVATLAWTAGQLVATLRSRIPAYDIELPTPGEVRSGPSEAGAP